MHLNGDFFFFFFFHKIPVRKSEIKMLRQLKCHACGKEGHFADKLKNVFCTNECFTSYTKVTQCVPHFNIGKLLASEEYRHLFYTDKNLQMGTQTLKPGESIGIGDKYTKLPEVHVTMTQVIIVFAGTAKVTIFSEEKTDSITLTADDENIVIIPPNMYHLVENVGIDTLRIFTIYSPPVH